MNVKKLIFPPFCFISVSARRKTQIETGFPNYFNILESMKLTAINNHFHTFSIKLEECTSNVGGGGVADDLIWLHPFMRIGQKKNAASLLVTLMMMTTTMVLNSLRLPSWVENWPSSVLNWKKDGISGTLVHAVDGNRVLSSECWTRIGGLSFGSLESKSESSYLRKPSLF